MFLLILLLCTSVCARDVMEDLSFEDVSWDRPDEELMQQRISAREELTVTSVPAPQPDMRFASPSGMCNVTVKFGGKQLIVSKEFLAVHSPVLAALMHDLPHNVPIVIHFSPDNSSYEDFVSLLEVIYPGRAKITDDSVTSILKLGYRYQIERALELTESHMKTSAKFDTVAKLHLADQYGLFGLTIHCLQNYSTVQELSTLQTTAEYATFSDSIKAVICDRFMELAKDFKFYN